MRTRTLKIFFGIIITLGLLILAIWQIPTIVAVAFWISFGIGMGLMSIYFLWLAAEFIDVLFFGDEECKDRSNREVKAVGEDWTHEE